MTLKKNFIHKTFYSKKQTKQTNPATIQNKKKWQWVGPETFSNGEVQFNCRLLVHISSFNHYTRSREDLQCLSNRTTHFIYIL